MNTFETQIDLDTPHGYLEGVPAVFDLDVEKLPAEDFAPAETAVSARFVKMDLDGLTLRENEAIAWLGRDTVNQLETWIEDTYEDDDA